MSSNLLPLFFSIFSLTLAQSPYSVSSAAELDPTRADAIANVRENFNYGPDIVTGTGSFYPVGSLAEQKIQTDFSGFIAEHAPWAAIVQAEGTTAAVTVLQSGGIATYDDYVKLYQGLWPQTIPGGPALGMLTNYTSDLLFSMERLSTQPYIIRRVQRIEKLNFRVNDAITKKLTGMTLTQLQLTGRLFYADHRDQGQQLPTTEGRFAAASDAFFYIHPESGDFLPLAIRPNNGSPLIYTPLDPKNDWQLAKMLFEFNDFYFAQWYHLGATHEVVEIVLEAATRTLSVDHPIYALLDRVGFQAFVFRVIANTNLLNVGGPVDRYLAWNSTAAATYVTTVYKSKGASFTKNYLKKNFEDRGLINSAFGPKLKSFPFFEDVSVIIASLKKFFTTFVDSYYESDADLETDVELQNFLAESQPAEIVDFPDELNTKSQLVDLLTHYAYLAAVLHGVLNSDDPVSTSATLPLHPTAFYQPLPTTKGLTDEELVAFMPNVTQSVGQIALLGAFNRPFFAGTNRTLSQMFNEETLLTRSNDQVREAAATYTSEMQAFSKIIKARTFDENGLSQGMPFIWKVLDPEVTGFSLVI